LALTLPSFSEGFGLPAIEALACGTPVLVSNAVAAAEFAGPAGLVFDPANPSEIGMCILELATNHMTQSRLRQQALKRAQSCSWSRAADLTLTILERCAAGC
jgi:glycosyltransferase involved in cell wall biosynthesis